MTSSSCTLMWEGRRVLIPGIGKEVPTHQILKKAAEEFKLVGMPLHQHYALRHQRRQLDLSMSLAQNGVPANALVDVVRTIGTRKGHGKDVKIALSLLPGGKRLVLTVPSESSLRTMLLAFATEYPIDVPPECIGVPGSSLLYVRERYESDQLDAITLASIGLSKGSARLTYTLPPSISTMDVDAATTSAIVNSTSETDGKTMGGATDGSMIDVEQETEMDSGGGAAVGSISIAPVVDSDGAMGKSVPDQIGRSSEILNEKDSSAIGGDGELDMTPDPAIQLRERLEALANKKLLAIEEEDYLGAASIKQEMQGVQQRIDALASGEKNVREKVVSFTDGANSSHSSESRSCDAMEVVGQVSTVDGDDAILAAMFQTAERIAIKPGMNACRSAIAKLCGADTKSFRADKHEVCAATLLKYLANVLATPSGLDGSKMQQIPGPRAIRCSNKAFRQRVAAVEGGIDLLLAVGFQQRQRGRPHEVARDPLAATFLMYDPDGTINPAKGDALLRNAFNMLYSAAVEHLREEEVGPSAPAKSLLRCDPQMLPKLPPPPPDPSTFDPFKASFNSTRGECGRLHAHKRAGQLSDTDRRLAELEQKRNAIESQGATSVDRRLCILPPNFVRPTSSSSTLPSTTAAAATPADKPKSDATLIAQAMAAKMAASKRREDAPFRTKAMRRIEELEKSMVYKETVLRIQFPDRLTVTAAFHPNETVASVSELVRNLLKLPASTTLSSGVESPFSLFVAPPKQTLSDGQATLRSLQLVPAAVVYVSWSSGIDPTKVWADGRYLNAEAEATLEASVASLSSTSAEQNQILSVPTGTALVPESQQSRSNPQSATVALSRASRGGLDRKGKSGGGSKPSWMKLG